MTREAKARLRCIQVLIEYVVTEIDSESLPGKAFEKLVADVESIPERCAALWQADERKRRGFSRKLRSA